MKASKKTVLESVTESLGVSGVVNLVLLPVSDNLQVFRLSFACVKFVIECANKVISALSQKLTQNRIVAYF